MSHKKSKVRKIVDKILSTQTSVYFGCKKPRWIRQKTDAKAGDTVTINGIKQRWIDKPPYPHYEEGYAVISHKRVYNGTLLCFDGKEWIQIDGGKICKTKDLSNCTDFAGVKYKCITCENEMTESRKFAFPICDDCINDMREIIKERRGK